MSAGPLSGVRILEVAGIGPGPFCGMLLADLGADVVRLDRPGGGRFAVVPPERDPYNRGKGSVEVDLQQPEGAELVLSLVERADALFEPFRPGVAERLGIGPAVCLERNPKLVYGRMTGWGQDGPLARTAGHDIGYLSITGALHAIGEAGGPPVPPLNLLGDFAGGSLYLAVGLLAGLLEAQRSGQGQVVDAAIVDGVSHMSTIFHTLLPSGAWCDERGANLLDGGAPFYGVYPTSDGRYMSVGALEPQFYAEFIRLLGLADDGSPNDTRNDPANWPQLRKRIGDAFAGRSRAEWTAVFANSDACVAPVLSLSEAPHDPHLRARGTFVETNGMVQPAPAPRFSRTPGAIAGPPALPGEHTDQVLADWLSGPPPSR